ncbi:MAG: hypothetical protein WC779_04650 [Candidatus Omnitrophota bacterium]|jgi:Ca2+/Na+ antiporter
MYLAVIGAVIGGTIGIIGGIVGTYFSIKNTGGPKERAFMIRCAVVMWVGAIAFIVLLFALPQPYSSLMWVVYGVALPLFIVLGNKIQAKIRNEEKSSRKI